MKWVICCLALCLSFLSYFRTDFFIPASITVPLLPINAEEPSAFVKEALLQPYTYLGKGRQCYAFISQDRKTVVKFFNHKYLQLPWYGKWSQKEKKKRELRQKYYRESYRLAFSEDSEILYLHLGSSDQTLPQLHIQHKANRHFMIDLNQIPFIVQKKGEVFYEALALIYNREGRKGLEDVIEQFISLISHRIEKKIADGDQDIEHNFSIIDKKVFHLDPGRLFYEKNLWQPDVLAQEWRRSTYRFRKWLLKKYPDIVPFLDRKLEIEVKKKYDLPSSF